jgi:hypothetical protein
MSNNIVAYVDGSDMSAVSYNGSTWIQKTNPPYVKWKVIAGAPGQYLYEAYDTRTPYSNVVYSTFNGGTTWVGGVLPNPSSVNIVAIAENDQYFYTSFDGYSFKSSKPLPFMYEISITAKSVTKATFAKYANFIRYITLSDVSNSHAYIKVPAKKLLFAVKALVTNIASAFTKGNSL